ncbi:MAG: GAP family protein [Acidimicrobiales bacterium]
MGDLLAHVLPLALGAAISPTILILNLMLLSDATYGRVRSAVFTLGAGLVLAGFSVFAYVVIKPVSSAQAQPDAFFGWLDLVAGVALIGLGVRALVSPPKPPKERPAGAEASAHVGEVVRRRRRRHALPLLDAGALPAGGEGRPRCRASTPWRSRRRRGVVDHHHGAGVGPAARRRRVRRPGRRAAAPAARRHHGAPEDRRRRRVVPSAPTSASRGIRAVA